MSDDRGLRFEAPIDAFVHKLSVTSSRVAKGQERVVLHSPELDRLTFRLGVFRRHLEMAGRPFHDGRVDEQIKTLTYKKDNLVDAVKVQEDRVKRVKDRFNVGEMTMEDVEAAQVTLLSLSRQQADAILAADQAEKKKQDMIDKLAITKGELDHHEHYLAQIKSSLTITAPTDGYFKALVAAGGAVKKGHNLGEMK